MTRGRRSMIAALCLWGSSASGLDVSGNWSITAASYSTITAVSFVQDGTALSVCLSGWGPVASGTIDQVTGAFSLDFDPSFANRLDEFGTCGLQWTGTFTADGNGVGANEIYSRGCPLPPGFCCLPQQTNAISGSRVSPSVACCGNGIVEGGEACDVSPGSGQDCCANDCTLEPQGHFCGADDQCHLRECDAAGVCAALPPVDCGPCYACDPVQGCLADLRSDCAAAGSGAQLRVIQRPAGTKVAWRWREGTGPRTVPADFGNPTVDADYQLCVFTRDVVASGLPLVAASLPAATSCGGNPCWMPANGGFLYRDPSGSAAGVIRARLLAPADRRATLKVAGRDVTLSPPLADEVIVQMSVRDASPQRCWSSAFTAPGLNVAGRYVATLP